MNVISSITHLATVKSHAELEAVVRFVFYLKCENLSQEVKSHLAYLHSVMLTVGDGNPRGHHVGIPDSLHLVDVVVINPVIEHLVEVVEELNDLVGGAVRADGGEADDVAEEDAGAVEHLRLRHLAFLQFLNNRGGQ